MTEKDIQQWMPLANYCLTKVLQRYSREETYRENGKSSYFKIAYDLKAHFLQTKRDGEPGGNKLNRKFHSMRAKEKLEDF